MELDNKSPLSKIQINVKINAKLQMYNNAPLPTIRSTSTYCTRSLFFYNIAILKYL